METESRLVVASGWGSVVSRNGGRRLNGYRVSSWGDENVLKWNVMMVAQPHEYTPAMKSYTLGKLLGM